MINIIGQKRSLADSEGQNGSMVRSDRILRQEREFYCLDIHLDLRKCGREHDLGQS